MFGEIAGRIRADSKDKSRRGDFAGVHPCPEGSSEVDDEPVARLVILGPQYTHRKKQTDTPGLKYAKAILDQRGNSPRINRNMLVFLAPDAARLDDLLQAAAQFLAWQSIQNERDALNLDTFQRSQADTKVKESSDTVGSRIYQTWTLALVPAHKEPAPGEQVKPEDLVEWQEIPIGGTDPLAKRTATKVKNDGALIPALGGLTLRHHLDEKLWRDKDHVGVGQLTEWFARYLYLPRVVNRDVILGAIKDGVGQLLADDTFAIAASFDEATGRYRGLQVRGGGVIENTTLLVKPTVASAQMEADEQARAAKHAGTGSGTGPLPKPRPGTGPLAPPEPAPKLQPNLFVGSVKLDGSRMGRDAGKVAEEVLQHLSTLPGARVEVRLEVQVHVPDGVGDDVVRTVTENANTLKFDSHGFERE